MGNSVKLCLLFATHLVAQARTHQTKIMIFDKAFISYLVIMSTCSGLPVNQEEAEEVVVKDEAIFEALRDHDLQLSMNGGQSGGWLLLFGESEETTSRPKRQDDAMADDLVVPPVVLPVTVAPTTTEAPAPIDDAYAQRLAGSAIALANKLANAKRQKIVRAGGYGRKKRQISEEDEAILQEISEIESLQLPESTVIQVIIPQVKSWGETGILLPVKSSA